MSIHGVPRELVTFDHELIASALDSAERNRLPGHYDVPPGRERPGSRRV
ncbi:MAG: hypothetical protein WD627_02475 [Actinomycetota bacterium]